MFLKQGSLKRRVCPVNSGTLVQNSVVDLLPSLSTDWRGSLGDSNWCNKVLLPVLSLPGDANWCDTVLSCPGPIFSVTEHCVARGL